MDRNTKNDSNPPPSGMFGKFLAVGMGVALVWGILMFFAGIYMRFKIGSVLGGMMGSVEDVVKVDSAVSPSKQVMLPLTQTIDDDINLGKWPDILGYYLIGVALVIILFACLGIYGGLKRSKFCLCMAIVFILIAIFCLVVLTTVTYDSSSWVHEDAKNEMVAVVKSEYNIESKSTFTPALNRIMLWFQCCGIKTVDDWHNLTFVEVGDPKTPTLCFKVPPACCIRALYNTHSSSVSPYAKLKDCAAKGKDVPSNINTKSCYDAVFDYMSATSTIFLVLVIVWNVLVLILSVLAFMEIRPEEEGGEEYQEARKEELEEAPPAKKFVPYAKISSFVHPDLSRIKSTEIW